MDTTAMTEWHRVEQEIEREFVSLCRRVLIGMSKREGLECAQRLLADYNAFIIKMTMRVKAFHGVR